MKKIINGFKQNKIIISFTTLFLFVVININKIFSAEFLYKDVPWVHDYLIKDEFFNSIKKDVGNFIYEILSNILNFMYDGFTQLAEWDIIKMTSVSKIITNIDTYIWDFILVVFLVVVICKMFKAEVHKVLINVMITCCVIVAFSTILSLANNAKVALMNDADTIIEKNNYTIGQVLYANNTIDIEKSMRNGNVTNIDVKNMDMIDTTERMTKKIIIDYPTENSQTGKIEYKDLQDGFNGIGDVRYFRYNTNFWNINFVMFSSLLVYGFAIYKMAFLVIEWLVINIFGKFSLTKGFFNYEGLGSIFKGILENLAGQVVTYVMMMLYTIVASEIMKTNFNFVVQALLLFAFGFTILMGSTFINNTMGIQDGSMRMLSSLMLGSRLARAGKRGFKHLKGGFDKVGDGADYVGEKIDEYAGKEVEKAGDKFTENNENNPELREALNMDKEQWEVDNAKEKMMEKEHKNDINEKAMKEVYGNDYKVKQAKDNILAKQEKESVHDKAMEEVYGKDYKVKQAKDDILAKQEKESVHDKALEEVYGKDYKVKQAKDDILAKQEKENVHDKALEEIHGKDYKVDVEEDKIIKSVEHSKAHDEAMKRLYGNDYKDKIIKDKAREKAKYYQELEKQKESVEYEDSPKWIKDQYNDEMNEDNFDEEDLTEILKHYG